MAGLSRFLGGEGRSNVSEWLFQLFPILLIALALLPRLVAIGRYITPDEAIWVYRSILFREAVLHGRWADTLVAGHPGVTTSWLGSLGMTFQLWLAPGAREAYDWLVTMAVLTPDNAAAFQRIAVLLTSGRVAVVLVNSLGIVGIYFLAHRLWGRTAALVAALFLAFDPFLVGLSGLLHVDGLSATFVALSLLSLAVGLRPREAGGSWVWPAAAGCLAGLAVLTKTPTLLLLPVSGLAMLWPLARDRRLPARGRWWAFLRTGVSWGAAFLATLLLLYPALWTTPAAVLATVSGSANRHLEEALRETYFLGRAAFDHGPLFYPIVLLWRLSPVVWLALIPAAALLIGRRGDIRRGSTGVFPVLLLVLWAVLFLVAITPAAKKFDRYILPVVPALLLLAAIAWAYWAKRSPRLGRWVLPLILLVQGLYWLAYAAYPLTSYNPLVGGPQTAVGVLPAGWGEGIGAAGRWLAQTQPDAEREWAMAGIVPSLAPFFPGTTLVDGLDDPATADYTIVTLGGRQLNPTGWDASLRGLDQIHVIRFGGLDQAWVYQNPSPAPPVAPPTLAEPVSFGDQLALTAVGQAVEGDVVTVAVRWRRLVGLPVDAEYTLRIVIRDKIGNIWAAQETDLLNEVYFYPPDWETDDTGVVRYLLELSPGIPPANYQITISMIDYRTGGQLPVRVGDSGFQGVEYRVGEIVVPAPETIVSASRLQIPILSGAAWPVVTPSGDLQLLGYNVVAAEALAGSRLPVDLFWHVPQGALPPGMSVAWRLSSAENGGEQIISTEPLSRYDTGLWRTGETIQEKYRLPLPPDLPPGHYELAVVPLLAGGEAIGSPYRVGELQIGNIERLYELPDDIPVSLEVAWEPLTLAGMAPAELTAEAGRSPELTLYWVNHRPHGEVYTVFVHVVNEAGEIVQYADHWPGGLPTDILDTGQVIVDRMSLSPDLPPGRYEIRVGLYSAESGARLPVIVAGETMSSFLDDDSITLPVVLRVTNP